MVKIKRCIAGCIFAGMIVFFCSCSLGLVWDRGHYVDDRYVPKKPNYKFKDKENNIVPSNLDTVNVYRKVAVYSGGMLKDMRPGFYFLKFYPNGRVLEVQISRNEPEVLQMSYQEVLSTKGIYVDTEHGYYYSKDGEKIQIEKFESSIYDWPVTGGYEIDNYYLNVTGDTLTRPESKENYKIIYVKEKNPRVLEDYLVTW